jgi:hypothetical protein
MAYLKDTWDWATLEAEIKAYLEITGSSEDVNLQKLLLVALRAADQFCNNPWTVEDTPEYMWGTQIDAIDVLPPDDVKLGVFERIREDRARIAAPVNPHGTVVTTKKTDALQESYGLTSRAWDSGPTKTWRDFLYPYRMDLFL